MIHFLIQLTIGAAICQSFFKRLEPMQAFIPRQFLVSGVCDFEFFDLHAANHTRIKARQKSGLFYPFINFCGGNLKLSESNLLVTGYPNTET